MCAAARTLAREVAELHFAAPVACVYNPLEYAWAPHAAYLKRYADAPKRVIYLGMNPGPFGMAQTGVPFGEIDAVRGWLGIEAEVGKPKPEHPRRPVDGFACARSEVSGKRLWGAIAAHYVQPERFFSGALVLNYCPLMFMEEGGRNRTPDKLPSAERVPLFAACDRHLRRAVQILEPEWIVGIGEFAAGRAREAGLSGDVQIGRILHPSPANPGANRGWEGIVARELRALGVCGTAAGRPG
jgi:single-strand selective monofunctional uracil DNA glycosylase